MGTMNPNTFKYAEWLWRIGVFVGIAANLYLTQNFVTRSTYERDKEVNVRDHVAMQTTISDIAVTLKLMAANQLRIDDHEARLRTVETRQTEVISRLGSIERNIYKE